MELVFSECFISRMFYLVSLVQFDQVKKQRELVFMSNRAFKDFGAFTQNKVAVSGIQSFSVGLC